MEPQGPQAQTVELRFDGKPTPIMVLSDSCAKPVNFENLAGDLDTRTLPGLVDPSSWRWLKNVDFRDTSNLCRLPGWQKLFHKSAGYNNQDLHDQLLSLLTYYDHTDLAIARETINSWPHAACGGTLQTKTEVRQPITFLMEAENTAGFRKLLVGTQTRLYASNESRGSYKVLSYGMGGKEQLTGCSPVRWYGDQAGDFTILTNNVDVPHYWIFDGPTIGCDQKAISPITDLALIGLTKAAVVVVWKGVVFFADVEMDGVRVNHRVVWGDKDKPLSYDPAVASSIAGTQDLDYGEKILGAKSLGNSLYFLTTKGIWKVDVIGGDEVYRFEKVYSEPRSGKACIAYRNTLVSDGDSLYYLGTDGIYAYNQFFSQPDRVPWMHLSSNTIFDDFKETACDLHVAGYNAQTGQMWVSWVSKTASCPDKSMIFNLIYKKATYVDHGFSAFVNFTSDKRETFADFLLRFCICTQAELDDLDITPLIKEPLLPSCAEQLTPANCAVPQSIYTSDLLTVGEYTVEDYNKSEPDEDSLCALLEAAGIISFDDLCAACSPLKVFVMASMEDYALKSYGGAYHREKLVNAAGCGTYTLDGFTTEMVKGPLSFGLTKEDKILELLGLSYEAELQVVPSEIILSVGNSSQPVDYNRDKCNIQWREMVVNKRYLKCLTVSLAEHAANKTRPNKDLDWPLHEQGKWLYARFRISGTGGASCFSSISMHLRRVGSCLTG